MLYLGEDQLRELDMDWKTLVDSIETAVKVLDTGDYHQPLKPYLRYRNPANRIIAMPAYIGGDAHAAGIKWIASFPGNLRQGLPRAHSVTILNDADTGQPYAIVNSAATSVARTAAVSGLMIRRFVMSRPLPLPRLRIGIIGWGPIGRAHYDMCCRLYGDLIDQVYLYDIRGVTRDSIEANSSKLSREPMSDNVKRCHTQIADSWQQLYTHSDIIITCTVSEARYIDLSPPNGSLLLNVSLRDYTTSAAKLASAIIVDDWNEVCRENTDIELLHRECGLTKEQTHTLMDVVCRNALEQYKPDDIVLFCPMGMAAFDVMVAKDFVRRAETLGIGIKL